MMGLVPPSTNGPHLKLQQVLNSLVLKNWHGENLREAHFNISKAYTTIQTHVGYNIR
jgi:hypothetical protein